MKKEKNLKYFINISLFIYFIMLVSERVISITSSINNNVNMFENPFNIFVYGTIFISIIGFIIYLITMCKDNIKFIFNKKNEVNSFKNILIASGILLLSGMVHSEYTIPGIQFASYGFYILALILGNILYNKNNKESWLSLIYLVLFSMAIPVVYHSNIDNHVLFHILEGITAYTLVSMFTLLTIKLLNGKSNLFNICIFITTLLLDTLLIVLRWNEEKNMFVLIFLIASSIMFIIGSLLSKKEY